MRILPFPVARSLFPLLLLLTACSSGNKTSTGRTERERDSIIGESQIPGAAVVKKARAAQDSGAARVERGDSVSAAE